MFTIIDPTNRKVMFARVCVNNIIIHTHYTYYTEKYLLNIEIPTFNNIRKLFLLLENKIKYNTFYYI